MYLLYIYFIFKSTKILPYFAASNQHFTGMPEYIKDMILNTLQVFYIYNKTKKGIGEHSSSFNIKRVDYIKSLSHLQVYLYIVSIFEMQFQ